MASGYYQLEVAEEDRDNTAFVTKYGLFSFRRMPFQSFDSLGTEGTFLEESHSLSG